MKYTSSAASYGSAGASKLIAAVAVLLLVTGCDAIKYREAKQLVSAQMRDPDSTKFRKLYDGPHGEVCGEVNARNGFGAMAGFTDFYVEPDGGFAVVRPSDAEEAEQFDRDYICACYPRELREEEDARRGWPKRACRFDP